MGEKKRKKQYTIYSLFGKIGDILFIPIIFIALMSSLFMLSSTNKSKPVSVFGFSLVRIKSGSMVELGFGIGDSVFTHTTSIDELVLGDIIAFYNFHDKLDEKTEKKVVIEFNYAGGKECDMTEDNINPSGFENKIDFSNLSKVSRDGEAVTLDAEKRGADVYFHQIIGIYVDDWGNVFYKTKGSHNTYADGYVRSDFVVGKYVDTPRWIRDIINFCSSTKGMIILVCFPLSILVLMDCFSLIEQVEMLRYEKEIIDGNIRIYDDSLKKNYEPFEMDLPSKVFVYFKTPPNEREKVKKLLWGRLYDEEEKHTKKELKERKILEKSITLLEKSNDEYWRFWLLETSGSVNRALGKYYNSIEFEVLYSKAKDLTLGNYSNINDKKEDV